MSPADSGVCSVLRSSSCARRSDETRSVTMKGLAEVQKDKHRLGDWDRMVSGGLDRQQGWVLHTRRTREGQVRSDEEDESSHSVMQPQ